MPEQPKTITLALVWEERVPALACLQVGEFEAGHIVMDSVGRWHAYPMRADKCGVHPTREAATAALERAVLGMGVPSAGAADAARFRCALEAWIDAHKTGRFEPDHAAYENAVNVLADADMAREDNDVG